MGENVQAPEWLTADFLQSCLHSDERYKGIIVTKFDTSAGVPPGNNYGSTIYRVMVDYKDTTDNVQTLSIIVKSPLTEGPFKDVSGFNTEPGFYSEFLPRAKLLLKKEFFAPENFLSPDPVVIVMKDLKIEGYLMADKTKKLDFDHCKLYMVAAAKFHAVSYALCREKPEIVSTVSQTVLYSNDSEIGEIKKKPMFYAVECLATHVGKIKGCEEFSKMLHNYSSANWDDLDRIHRPNEDFNCLNQIDPWIANMMFKYNESGRVTDIKLLDFQAMMFLSPVRDIIFFIHANSRLEVLKSSVEDLLLVYITELNNNLTDLNYNYNFTYQKLKEHMYMFIPVVIFVHAICTPCMQKSFPDFNKIYTVSNGPLPLTENPFEEYYTESYCTSVLPDIVRIMEREGVFSYLADRAKVTP